MVLRPFPPPCLWDLSNHFSCSVLSIYRSVATVLIIIVLYTYTYKNTIRRSFLFFILLSRTYSLLLSALLFSAVAVVYIHTYDLTSYNSFHSWLVSFSSFRQFVRQSVCFSSLISFFIQCIYMYHVIIKLIYHRPREYFHRRLLLPY
jgi:hypothetical protein